MVRFLMLIFVLALFLSACGDMSPTLRPSVQTAAQPTSTTQPTATGQSDSTTANNIIPGSPQDEDAMREALLRYRFGQVNLTSYPDSKYYCFGFETTMRSASNLQDPPQALLNRLKGNKPPVVKASECDMVGDKMDDQKVVFKNSGEQAIIWGLGSVNWSGKDKA